MTEITKSTEAKKDEMQVEKEKLESVKRADAAVKTMHDFTSPEVLYKELINKMCIRDSLLPCSARDCIRILFTVVIAVSAEEKNEESAISIRIATA